jgi:NAD(P)-dependent dehydrogenase (short-subunit alcohol dehydrogenase family)
MKDHEWVLVTGAGRGIGEGIALRLAGAGTNVALAAMEQDELQQVAAKVEEQGAKFCVIRYDARDEQSVLALFSTLEKQGIVLNRVVCNAGVYSGLRLLSELPVDEFDEVMTVNARGTFLCCRAAVRHMRGRTGAIVNISSTLGKRSLPAMGVYCASKAAINSLTRTLALECAPTIRVNSVCPGPVQTTMMERGFPQIAQSLGIDMSTLQAELMRGFPLQRIATVEDVVEVAVFLLSDAARNITGQCINTDAGWLMEV